MDFEALRTGADGVMLRAGYGRGNIDRQFARSAAECVCLGIPFGAYWFSYAHSADMARAEARALLGAVEPYDPPLPLAFDYEYDSVSYGQKRGAEITPALVRDMAAAFRAEIEAAGRRWLLYANPDFIARYFGDAARSDSLWLAQWPARVDVTKPPRACAMWQWGTSEVPGVAGAADTNEAYSALWQGSGADTRGERAADAAHDAPVGAIHESPAVCDDAALDAALATPQSAPPTAPLAGGPGDGEVSAPGDIAGGEPPAHGDVPAAPAPAPWYAPAMAWACSNGICDGLRPGDFATRAEVAQMFYNLTHPTKEEKA